MRSKSILANSSVMVRYLMAAKIFLLIFLISLSGYGQDQAEKVKSSMKEFHRALISKDGGVIDRLTHSNLSYGHSNGWIETKTELMDHNKSGYLIYQSFTEDSVQVSVSGKVSYIRFVADIRSSMNKAAPKDIRLKVVEVWVMDKKDWRILVRQAVR